MEITLDVGKNIFNDIEKIAKTDNEDFEITALKLLDLGVRVHLANLKQDGNDEADPILTLLLIEAIKSNNLLKEVLGHVFIKEKSIYKAYDAESAYRVVEHMAKACLDNKTSF